MQPEQELQAGAPPHLVQPVGPRGEKPRGRFPGGEPAGPRVQGAEDLAGRQAPEGGHVLKHAAAHDMQAGVPHGLHAPGHRLLVAPEHPFDFALGAADKAVERHGHLEDQRRLFAIFQRLHRNEDYPGTGIGLSTCKKFIELCGGDIGFESAPGQGTSVKIYLPGAEQGAIQTADHPETSPQGAGQAVLLVEDDPSVRLLIGEVLSELEDGDQGQPPRRNQRE